MPIVAKNRQDAAAIQPKDCETKTQSTAHYPHRFVAEPVFEKYLSSNGARFGITSGHEHTLTCFPSAISFIGRLNPIAWAFVIENRPGPLWPYIGRTFLIIFKRGTGYTPNQISRIVRATRT
jgi:hypothetical protein